MKILLPKLPGESFQKRQFRKFWNNLSEKEQNRLSSWCAEIEARGLDFGDHLRERFKAVYGIDI
ncbi:MAG: hypothetical protein SWQ30_06630 [Thermodesulfobacteriota bacterium]|nr:hypothetical protein [Thermodesulfobacteriota bacterium]